MADYDLPQTGDQIRDILNRAQQGSTIDQNISAKYTKPATGIPLSDLVSALQALINGAEQTSNKVTVVTSQSTDDDYPSAKCVYDVGIYLGGEIATLQGQVTTLESGKVNKASGTPTLFALGKDSTGIFIELGD